MASDTVVRARIDGQVKERAAKVLAEMGLSVSDAIRLLLVRVATEKAPPFDLKVSEHGYGSGTMAEKLEHGKVRGSTKRRPPHRRSECGRLSGPLLLQAFDLLRVHVAGR